MILPIHIYLFLFWIMHPFMYLVGCVIQKRWNKNSPSMEFNGFWMDKLGVRTRQKFSSFFSSFTLDTISDKSFGGVRVEYLEAKSAVCGLVCFSSDFVCIGDGRDLLSEAKLLAVSSANELKAVIGVALFKRGIILLPSFAHSCSVLQSPVRLRK